MDALLVPTATQVRRHVIRPNAVIDSKILLPHEYFRTRLKACIYCMQELQHVA